MQVHLLKSKIHRAQVTASSPDYEGSLTIALDLMDTLPDVLMPPGWRIEEPPAPPSLPRDGGWRAAQLWDAYAAAVREHDAAAHAAARS